VADDRTVTVTLVGGPLDGYSCVTLESKTRQALPFPVLVRGTGHARWLTPDPPVGALETATTAAHRQVHVVYRWYRTTTGPAGVQYWYHLAEE
jgi:hypothetical protein